MAIDRQEPFPDVQPGPRRRVWCRGLGCGRELTDPISRMRQLGAECDPEPRTGHHRFDVDQDPLPGM